MTTAQPGQEQRMDDLIERLRARTVIRKGAMVSVDLSDGRGPQEMSTGDIVQQRNPDGPEAADRLILYREALGQANVDILTVLGAVRDDMPAEAVAIFQRIARDLGAVLSRSGH